MKETNRSFLVHAALFVGLAGFAVPVSADAMARVLALQARINSTPGTMIVVNSGTVNLILGKSICVGNGNFENGSNTVVQNSDSEFVGYDNENGGITPVFAPGSAVICVVYDGTPDGRAKATERASQELTKISHSRRKPVMFQKD